MTDNWNNPQQPPQGQPAQPYGQQPQWSPPPQQGYGAPAYGPGQQPGNPGYGAPQPQFQGGPPQQFGQQPYHQQPNGPQPYGAPVAAGPSSPSRILGWLMALFAVLAIAFCFGPWASAKVSSTVLPISSWSVSISRSR